MSASASALTRPPFNIDYGPDVEPEVDHLAELIAATPSLAEFPPRWLAIKLLEAEHDIVDRVASTDGTSQVLAQARVGRDAIEAAHGDTADMAIADARYGYVHGVAMEVVDTSGASRYTFTDRLDRMEAFYASLGFVTSDRYPGRGVFMRCAPHAGHDCCSPTTT